MVTVKTDNPECTFAGMTPAPVQVNAPVGPIKGLGAEQDASSATAGIQTNIAVTTATDVDEVSLFIDGVFATKLTNSGSTSVTFNAVDIPEGTHQIQVKCTDTAVPRTGTSGIEGVLADGAKPSAAADFSCTVTNNRAGEVTCTWTAVADPGAEASGMEQYEVRYTVGAPLTGASWASAATAATVTANPSGTTHDEVFTGLPLETEPYYFGIRGRDFVQNASDLTATADHTIDFQTVVKDGSVTNTPSFGSVMAAGDFDCDGFTDLAVGDPSANSDMGWVYIYLGTANGITPTPIKNIIGTVPNGQLGAGLAALDNFDGDADGCTDLAVYAAHQGTNQARVYVYLGRQVFFDREDVTTGLGAELYYALPSSAGVDELLGPAISSAGDFDGDGAADLAIAHQDLDAAADAGSVYLVYGDTSITPMGAGVSPAAKLLPDDAGVAVTGGVASAGFGTVLAAGGQLDGDTTSELLVGAPTTTNSGVQTGAVYVVTGGARAGTLPETIALSSTRVVTITGDNTNVSFGASVGFVGDMDGVTGNEFAVGDPGFSGSTGQVFIFNLQGSSLPASPADATGLVVHNIPGSASDKLGIALGGAGSFAPVSGADLNQDGFADLVAAVESTGTTGDGAAYLIDGESSLSALSTANALYTFAAPSGAAAFGNVVLLAQDFDADGYVDVVIADPAYGGGVGRFHLYH
jgi:hypothetical protein